MKSYLTGLEELRSNKTSGSSELALLAGLILIKFEEVHREIEGDPALVMVDLCKEILQAQPQMASIFNLVNGVLLILEKEPVVKRTRKFVFEYLEKVQESKLKLAANLINKFPNGSCLLLHSYSSTILNILLELKKLNISYKVICTESRPMMEGRILALKLAEADIETVFITESAAWSMMSSIDGCLFGADVVLSEGIVNKAGTAMIALAAKHFKKPVYAISDTSKFLPGNCRLPEEALHPTDELWPKSPSTVSVANYYFETIPIELFTSLITDEGLFTISRLKSRLQNLPLSKYLKEYERSSYFSHRK